MVAPPAGWGYFHLSRGDIADLWPPFVRSQRVVLLWPHTQEFWPRKEILDSLIYRFLILFTLKSEIGSNYLYYWHIFTNSSLHVRWCVSAPLPLSLHTRWRFLRGKLNAMRRHVSSTVQQATRLLWSASLTSCWRRHPAHVGTRCQSNKAATNRWLLFSRMTPTAGKLGARFIFTDTLVGLQAFSFSFGSDGPPLPSCRERLRFESTFWLYAALVRSAFGPPKSQLLCLLTPHSHTCCSSATYSSCRDKQYWLGEVTAFIFRLRQKKSPDSK